MIRFIKSIIRRFRDSMSKIILQHRVRNKNFTVISNDCWGGEIYKSLNLPYTTPFVGLMVMSPCYIKLLKNLPYYMSQDLQFKDRSRYDYVEALKKSMGKDFPIGILDNEIELHFLHYATRQEAYEKWTRRTERINWKNIFLKYDVNKDLGSSEDLYQFDQLPYPKVSFGISEEKNINSYIKVDRWNWDAAKFFNLSLKKFDVVGWLNGGNGKIDFFCKLNYYLFHKKV